MIFIYIASYIPSTGFGLSFFSRIHVFVKVCNPYLPSLLISNVSRAFDFRSISKAFYVFKWYWIHLFRMSSKRRLISWKPKPWKWLPFSLYERKQSSNSTALISHFTDQRSQSLFVLHLIDIIQKCKQIVTRQRQLALSELSLIRWKVTGHAGIILKGSTKETSSGVCL